MKSKKLLKPLCCLMALIVSTGFFQYINLNAAENKTEWNFDYTGHVEEWTAPYTGQYFLDIWGASGGGTESGGGHSFGYINLHAGEKLYIAVGQKGEISPERGWSSSPYNGGGKAYGGAGSGGGATSITKENRGELKNFEAYKSEVVLVAGASGGIGSKFKYSENGCYIVDEYLNPGMYVWNLKQEHHFPTSPSTNLTSGYGGGTQGSGAHLRATTTLEHQHGYDGVETIYGSTGADIITGGYAFGQGGPGSNISNAGYGGGAGGGYYGGYAYNEQPKDGSEYRSCGILFGGGGCGYMSDELIDADSVANNNIGNGKAKIKYAGQVTSKYIIDIGDIGTVGGQSGTVTISGIVGTTGTIPKVVLKEGYEILEWKVEYNTCATNVRPSTEKEQKIEFDFGDIRIEAKYKAPLTSNVIQTGETSYDLNFEEDDSLEKIYALSQSYDGGNIYEPVSASSSLNDLSFFTYSFGYKGGVEGWTAPFGGNWLLEVSGGSAASDRNTISGGYSKGYKRLQKGNPLYICCGGVGQFGPAYTKYSSGYGGYNGGAASRTGSNRDHRRASGSGGATSITTTNRGVLANFNSYRGEVVIVAGGAGAVPFEYGSGEGAGGYGGGLSGGNGTGGSSGGTQGGGYAFGQGQSLPPRDDQGAGGGGWYGGRVNSGECKGGGGSGYIGASQMA